MSSVEQAYATQIANIQKKTGKSEEQLIALVKNSGLSKHGEIRTMLMEHLGIGYGDANSQVHYVLKSDGERAAAEMGLSSDAVLDEIYTGAKAALRPIHEKLMDAINQFGEFEVAPKKGYVSLRRKKQFVMLGPATNTRFELGINHKSLAGDERLLAQPAGSMCNYKVKLNQSSEVDEAIIAWIRQAYEAAG
jgi:hypothetical protein